MNSFRLFPSNQQHSSGMATDAFAGEGTLPELEAMSRLQWFDLPMQWLAVRRGRVDGKTVKMRDGLIPIRHDSQVLAAAMEVFAAHPGVMPAGSTRS